MSKKIQNIFCYDCKKEIIIEGEEIIQRALEEF